MSWWQARKARKDLEETGIDKKYLQGTQTELKQGHKQAKQLRNELRKKESPTYRKLITKINDITYTPVPAQLKYSTSLDLVRKATLSDWERADLLAQIENIYRQVLTSSPYAQVLSTLNHLKNSDLPRMQKITLSTRLVENSELTAEERQNITEQVANIYKV